MSEQVDFSALTPEEKAALEKECLKHLYIVDFFEKHGVDLALLSKEVLMSIRAQANIYLRDAARHPAPPGASNEDKQIVHVIVKDGVSRTYDKKDDLKAIGLHFDKEQKAWVGELHKGWINKLRDDGLTVEVVT